MPATTMQTVWRACVRRCAAPIVAVSMLLATPGALATGTGYTAVSGSPFTVRAHTLLGAIAFSPSGRLLAATTYPAGIAGRSQSELLSVAPSGRVTALPGVISSHRWNPLELDTFSPNGRLISASVGNELMLYGVGPHGLAGKLATWRIPVAGVAYSGALFSPTGRVIAVPVATRARHHNVRIELYMVAVGRHDALHALPGSPVYFGSPAGLPGGFAFSPNGRRLAISDVAGQLVSLYAIGADGSASARPLSTVLTPEPPTDVEYSPDGRLIAVTYNGPGYVSMFAVGAGGALRPVPGSPFATGSGAGAGIAAFSPDGRRLVVTAGRGTEDPVFAVGAGGELQRVQRLRAAERPVLIAAPNAVVFSPDGRLLAIISWTEGTVWMFAAR